MRADKGFAPVAVVALGILLLCILDAVMKALAVSYGIGFLVLFRYGFGAIWAVLLFFVLGGVAPGRRSIRQNFARTFVVIGTALCFFYALARLPFAETLAITFTAPIFIALLGWVILGERVAGRVMLAVGLGSAGVVVILSGRISPATFHWANLDGVVAALLSAAFYGLATVLLRKQTGRDPILTIVVLQNVFALFIVLPLGVLQWSTPSSSDLLLGLAAGLFGTLGHLAMAWGYARAEAARLGALEYTGFIWASLFGWAFFSETPSPLVLVGAALIVSGAMAANWGAPARAAPLIEEV